MSSQPQKDLQVTEVQWNSNVLDPGDAAAVGTMLAAVATELTKYSTFTADLLRYTYGAGHGQIVINNAALDGVYSDINLSTIEGHLDDVVGLSYVSVQESWCYSDDSPIT